MKVEREGALARARTSGRAFGEALARARGDGARQSASQLERRQGGVADRTSQAARRAPDASREPNEAHESAGETPSGAVAPGPSGPGGERSAEPTLARPATADPHPALAQDPAPALPPLREVVRALPPAIDAARVREGQPLELAFGSALKVDLRVGRDGVELTLRPDARLTRAAQAELPGLVRALTARGVRVARAGVGPALARNDPDGRVAR